ncbi:MAG: arginyl-tRNA synthetase, partial [Microgenomates bacterium 39_7]
MLEIERRLTKFISSLPLVKVKDVELEHPADVAFGDYSTNIAMKLFGSLKPDQKAQLQVDNPRELAQHLCSLLQENLEKFSELSDWIDQIDVAGSGFINFHLSKQFLIDSLAEALLTPSYGESDSGKGQVWELEHTSPNPNKAMHLGHLRNNLVGMAIGRIWEAVGIKVIFEAVDNNRGIAIAKLMWGYLKFARKDENTPVNLNHWYENQEQWSNPQETGERPDRFVDRLYVQGATDFDRNKQVEQQVRQMVVDWEANDKATWALWKLVLDFSYQGQQLTLKRLGNRWDKVWHEHEYYQQGKELVEEGIKKGVFKVLSDGAVLTDLKKFGLADTIVRKADGTALYITQDIALTKLKMHQRVNRLHWVVGPEQKLALEQLFAICEQLNIARARDLEHLTYGYMSIKNQGKMSSREGNVIYIDELLDRAHQKASELINQDGFNQDEITNLAEKVGMGAVKYAILKVSRTADMAFDEDSALSLEGNSGPYLQYSYARANSVLQKSGITLQELQELYRGEEGSTNTMGHEESYITDGTLQLLRLIYQYPEVIEQSAYSSDPSSLATFLYEIAKNFNSFYNKHQILV